MGMMDAFKIPKDPHEGEPDELTPDTDPLDDVEHPQHAHDDPDEGAGMDRDERQEADRTPRP